MVRITYSESFEKDFKKVKDGAMRDKMKKHILKVLENPLIGKPPRYDLKGERTVYVKPYRLIYAVRQDEIILLRFHHRKDVYDT